MLRSLANSAAGIDAHAKRVDVIAHNIANINTVGYKKQHVSFAELFHQELVAPGVPANPNPPNQRSITEGSGVKVSGTRRDWQQGTVVQTGRSFDFAIQGSGFFEVELPDGTIGYTRSGVLSVDQEGWLITAQGYRLTAPVEIGPEFQNIVVSSQGIITGRNPDGEMEELGYWPLYNFTNPAGLKAVGENIFVATKASGALWEGMPGEDGLGEIKQGFLENANVLLAEEITGLIEAQRAYQINSRALQAADEMWSIANNLRR